MVATLDLPITNTVTGGAYTGVVHVGAGRTPLALLLDTGSSTLVVDGRAFDPSGERTTNLVQTVTYGAGSWVGAVVQTSVALGAEVVLGATQLAVTYGETAGMFSAAQGILGLAYAPLDAAWAMPGDTWATRYTPEQLAAGTMIDLAPYFTQLEEAGVVANKLGFVIRRAATSHASDDPAADPANAGLLVIGGGEERTELYAGAFTDVAVVHDQWYDTNLRGVQVGTQPVIAVPPAGGGNSFVDSGTSCLMFAQPVHDAILAAFHAIDPAFAAALTASGVVGGTSVDQATLELARWPELRLILEGPGGVDATLAVPPASYWQLDAGGRGQALAYLCGGAQTILGLPLFCDRYTVFDRSMDAGLGVIRFATRAAGSGDAEPHAASARTSHLRGPAA